MFGHNGGKESVLRKFRKMAEQILCAIWAEILGAVDAFCFFNKLIKHDLNTFVSGRKQHLGFEVWCSLLPLLPRPSFKPAYTALKKFFFKHGNPAPKISFFLTEDLPNTLFGISCGWVLVKGDVCAQLLYNNDWSDWKCVPCQCCCKYVI